MKMANSRSFICRCFLQRNFFVDSPGLHLTYTDRSSFTKEYGQILQQRGITNEGIADIVSQIEDERERRKCLSQQKLERCQLIRAKYGPIHPHVYHLQESFLSPDFVRLVEYCKSPGAALDGLLMQVDPNKAKRVYTIPMFTWQFCQELLEELLHFEKSDLPKGRPNTMNNYGILLDEVGFDEGLLTPLREKYLSPLTSLLYPECGGASLDSHKAFIVTYRMGEDVDLSYHYDNAEVTLNVSLGGEYEEGSLYFGGMRMDRNRDGWMTESTHKVTYGILHRGQHMHGAMPITEGERHNLIIWMRSSTTRNQLCPMCDNVPDLVETAGGGDGFTQPATVNVCSID